MGYTLPYFFKMVQTIESHLKLVNFDLLILDWTQNLKNGRTYGVR